MAVEAAEMNEKLPQFSLFVFSFNHHTASMDVRERMKLNHDAKVLFAKCLKELEGLESFVIVDTCNRWECYAVASHSEVRNRIWGYIVELFPFGDAELRDLVQEFRESEMVQHLFEVSSGIDSQMVGETEILGQVKAAFAEAEKKQHLDMVLHRIFSKAFQAAKWVRTHTLIGQGHVSIGNISAELAGRIFGSLSSCHVLLIGSGEVGRLTAQALKNRNAGSLSFASRTLKNSERLAGEIGGRVIDFEGIHDHLHQFDIVVSCTGSQSCMLSKQQAKLTMRKRSQRPLFIIDLAMPRDIDPVVGKLSQVFLYNLDDVSMIANENLESRSQEIENCKKNVSSKAWFTWIEIQRRLKMRSLKARTENESLKVS